MQHAVGRFGHVLKFLSNVIARHRHASVSGGGAGSRQNADTILTTATTRHARNARGASAIPITGANIAARTRSTANATARSSVNATPGEANA